MLLCTNYTFAMTKGYQMKKVILITGARGIGLATAVHLAMLGYTVYGTTRNASDFEKILSKDDLKDKLHFINMDVRKESSVKNAIDKIIQNEGRLDVVINSAAIGVYGPAEEISLEQAKEIFDVNFFGILRVLQNALPHFRKQGHGLLINISSMAAIDPLPGTDLYSASKYAVEGLSESMAGYLSLNNIKVVLVEPGPVNTQFIAVTSVVGKRLLPDKPYGDMSQKIYNLHKEILAKGQDPTEVAKLIEEIIVSPNPNPRYQTSTAMQKIAKKYQVDPTGVQSFQEKKQFAKEVLGMGS